MILPLCTTEFLAFASCYNKFKELDAELLALSIGATSSHLAWMRNIYYNSKVVTPANWEKGMPTIVKAPNTYEDLKERVLNSSNYNFFDWYLCFKKELEE